VNIEVVAEINRKLKTIREELAQFDSYKLFPIEFDLSKDTVPQHIDKLFDQAIEHAKNEKEEDLIATCQAIEKYFNFPDPDEAVKNAQIPGGMYTNMLAQLQQLKLEQLLPRVLEMVPSVRIASGCPPLVTPTSQIVGVQAVNCVIDENSGNPPYTNKSSQYVNMVKGSYGKTPVEIDPEFRLKICGHREEMPYDTTKYKKQDNPELEEFGHRKLAKNEKEELLLELFPAVAKDFLTHKVEEAYIEEVVNVEREKIRQYNEKRAEYERLSPEEKEKKVLEGLYHYQWTSTEEW